MSYKSTRCLLVVVKQVSERPVTTLLAGETFEVVDVAFRFHDHLERRNHLGAGRTVPGRTEQSAEPATNRTSSSHTAVHGCCLSQSSSVRCRD